MNSHTTPSFWQACDNLPTESQKQADEKFDLWKKNPHHPSLRYKCVKPEKQFWSARTRKTTERSACAPTIL